MENKSNKNTRTLDMYIRLREGKIINKTEEANRFGVDERSIQRDIDDIRAFFDNRSAFDSSDGISIVYDRSKKGYVMEGKESAMMTNSEVLAVSKILLESRAFTKKEISSILNKLVEGCVPLKNMKLVSDLIANEKFHYVELHHKSRIQDKLWELGEDIKEHKMIQLEYQRTDTSKKNVTRIVEPVAIMFSEYYFYLNAYIVDKDEERNYVHRFDYPAIFRIDRIISYKEIGKTFKVAYNNRFEEGEFRKKIQFMYPGELMRVRLRFSGENPEAVLDRLPTARIISEAEKEWIIEAEVYGKGIVMWLLSQGTRIEVLKPDSLRAEMKQTLMEMLDRY